MTTTDSRLAGNTEIVRSRVSTVTRDLLVATMCFLGLSLLYWTAAFVSCGRPGFPLDDAYIHLQFARNLYETGLMAFNKGTPSSGSTAPLYPYLLTLVYSIVHNWMLSAYIIGAIFSLGTAWCVYAIALEWTRRPDLARWAGILVVVVNPTVVQSYAGMESPVYSFIFLCGLWCYSRPQHQLVASLFWACGIWLRPEFVLLLPFICLEQIRRNRTFARNTSTRNLKVGAGHILIWSVFVASYIVYHYRIEGVPFPNTFSAKTLSQDVIKPGWMDSLPAAIHRGTWLHILSAVTLWPTLIVASVAIGMVVNCAPLAMVLPRSIRTVWNTTTPAAAAGKIAVLVLVCYPWLRGVVDNVGFFHFQQQRYFAHLTPLAVLIVVGATARSFRAASDLRRFRRRTFVWAGAGLCLTGIVSVISVSNINHMQVSIAKWIRESTQKDDLIACNDIGAIAFISRRPILDTVGLVEPEIIEHYRRGGTLTEYLQQHDPKLIVIFPDWYEELSARSELVEPVFSARLDFNVVCGGAQMVVYKPLWKNDMAQARSAVIRSSGVHDE